MNVCLTTTATNAARQGQRPAKRAGVAAVEVAVTLPLLILLVFGSMEVANGIFLNQSLSVAAFEGAREAGRPGGTSASARQKMIEVLSSRSIKIYTLAVDPVISDSTPRGTQITATVQAPMNSLAGHTIGIIGNRMSLQKVVMVRN